MPKTDIAKLFQNGRSQAVRLPREFRFEGDRVRIRRVGQGVLLEPRSKIRRNVSEARRIQFGAVMPEGRQQPKTPKRRIFD